MTDQVLPADPDDAAPTLPIPAGRKPEADSDEPTVVQFPAETEPATVRLEPAEAEAATTALALDTREEPEAEDESDEPEPEPERRSRAGLIGWISLGVVAVLVAVGAFAAVQLLSGGVTKAKVGDCLGGTSAPGEGQEAGAQDAKVVDCGSSKAAFKVVARFDKKKLADADAACRAYPNAPFVFTAIPKDGTGIVLCLSKIQS